MSLKLAVFDMDGTITAVKSSWEYVHKCLNMWDSKGKLYLDMYLNGDISYDTFCQLDAREWQGVEYSKILNIIDTIPVRPGMQELFHLLKINGVYISIISTGLSILSEKISRDFNVDFYIANDLEVRDGLLTGQAKINVSTDLDGIRKRDYLISLMNKFQLSKNETVSFGDSSGDIEMFQATGSSFYISKNNYIGLSYNTHIVKNIFDINDLLVNHFGLVPK